MNEKVLVKLEYHKIIELLVRQCSTQLGKELADALKPSTDLDTINRLQSETTEAKEIQRFHPGFTLGGVRDIRAALRKSQAGGIIEPPEFLSIYDTVGASKRIKKFFSDEDLKYKLLSTYADKLTVFTSLEQHIKKTITNEGEVSEDASVELSRIRKQLRNLQGKAREKLESMIRSSEIQKILQEQLITIRNDRYVIPVKQEYRYQVQGLVHDQSASGATLFIEPLAVVEMTNEAQRYEAMERVEVLRILRHLTGLVAEQYEDLCITLDNLGALDFIIAKAKLSRELDCGQPIMNDRGYIQILQGRHPLIQGKVVPSTIYLGKDFDVLVITGPNTGGKTVTLKTVGLFILMAQAGLHVPAQVGTELSVFQHVFSDIGDEQSIEQSLSTFSSHMTNIINILENLNEKTLVLLDELGAGTDPTEGAALAMAILEHLLNRGTKVIATTHYSELKSFAYNKDRVENASVEFDVETLRPTYRLLIGVPGKSNAFEISTRLGLKPEVVDKARSFLSAEEVRVADLIANLETNQILSEKERQEAEKLKSTARNMLIQVEKKEEELKTKAQSIIQKAQQEALEIVIKARMESDAALKELKEKLKKAPQETRQELLEMRNQLREKEEEYQKKMYEEDEGDLVLPQDLFPGDLVLLKRLNQKAQVLEKPNKEEVLVQAGIMKITVKLQDILRLGEERAEKKIEKTGIGSIVAGKARTIKHELDLRGYTVDEALLATEKFLDDAFLAGIPQAYIIHGKGTGALRKAISDMLRKHHSIDTSRIGGHYEGGHGVTVVEFKK
ncbi:MAG: endonuclease MutS2 [Firmicutes bacterium HGW-Firmicutes-12]|jgi:DNA mismatch repair protein MutS2|nr:MAG: endonuclease MutS2 [Firmicutes bacterium HGW-Firmicutes-12]